MKTQDVTKIVALETGLDNLTGKLSTFIDDSKEHRRVMGEELSRIWQAHNEQGERMTEALNRLSSKGAITWPLLVSTGGFVLTLVLAAAGLGHAFVESRSRQLEIELRHSAQDHVRLERKVDQLEERLRETCR